MAPTSRSRTRSQRLPDQDQVGVVRDVAAGRSQVDDRPGAGRGVAKGMDVSHDIVAKPLLVRSAAAKSIASTLARSAPICSSVIVQPQRRSASARATQSRRQVENSPGATRAGPSARLAYR